MSRALHDDKRLTVIQAVEQVITVAEFRAAVVKAEQAGWIRAPEPDAAPAPHRVEHKRALGGY